MLLLLLYQNAMHLRPDINVLYKQFFACLQGSKHGHTALINNRLTGISSTAPFWKRLWRPETSLRNEIAQLFDKLGLQFIFQHLDSKFLLLFQKEATIQIPSPSNQPKLEVYQVPVFGNTAVYRLQVYKFTSLQVYKFQSISILAIRSNK